MASLCIFLLETQKRKNEEASISKRMFPVFVPGSSTSSIPDKPQTQGINCNPQCKDGYLQDDGSTEITGSNSPIISSPKTKKSRQKITANFDDTTPSVVKRKNTGGDLRDKLKFSKKGSHSGTLKITFNTGIRNDDDVQLHCNPKMESKVMHVVHSKPDLVPEYQTAYAKVSVMRLQNIVLRLLLNGRDPCSTKHLCKHVVRVFLV